MSAAEIFVADDNPILLQGISRALSAGGYTVRTASSGSGLLSMLRAAPEPPDLLLLDVMMPEMSGLDVLREVHGDSRWSDLPVVLITAASDESLPVSALQSGAVDFLTKPFRLGELMARIEAHVRRYRTIRKARTEARAQVEAMNVVRGLHDATTAEELFTRLVVGASEIWRVRRCQVVVDDGPEMVRIVASSEPDPVVGRLLELRAYPEIRAALKGDAPVLVTDALGSELFDAVRREWQREGLAAPVDSVAVLPFRLPYHGTPAALVVRSAPGEPRVDDHVLGVAVSLVEGVRQGLERAQIVESLIEQRREMEDLAHRDELTGCATRRALFARLDADLRHARESNGSLGLVLLDVDHFKSINDTYGHLAGDTVLGLVGDWLAREGNGTVGGYVGRYGGDEFIIVLRGADLEGAYRFAEYARAQLSQIHFVVAGEPLRVTFSAGAAAWPLVGGDSVEELLASADDALYQAKRAGRDCVRLAHSTPESVIETS
jgi:two-component system, cell cycle response regulator